MDTIEQEFFNLFKEFARKNKSDITLESRFKELGIDSLSLTELILACEDKFNVLIEADDEVLAEAVVLKTLYDAIVLRLGPSVSTK